MSEGIQLSASETRKIQRNSRKETILSALTVVAFGFLATLLVYVWIYNLQAQGRSPAALSMAKDMDMSDMHKFWSFPILQACGLTGFVFAYFSILLGFFQQISSAITRFPLSYQQINRYHRHISLLVVGLVVVHIVATALDAMGDSWKTVLIPGQWAYQGWPEGVFGYNTGIFASYLLISLAPTFYIGQRVEKTKWHFFHRFVLVFYILSFWHAMILGQDIAYYSWIRPTMWLSQIPLLLLFMKRLQRSINQGEKSASVQQRLAKIICKGLFATSAVAIIAIFILVVTGRSGFIATV